MPRLNVLENGQSCFFANTAKHILVYDYLHSHTEMSIIWTNPVIRPLLQNDILTLSRNKLSFLDNGRTYQIFIYVPNIKKKKKIKN
jgi:hypothetical protein